MFVTSVQDSIRPKRVSGIIRFRSVQRFLLPGSERRARRALDALAEGAQATAEDTHDTEDPECQASPSVLEEKSVSFAHVARTPEDRDESVSDVQRADQGENGGRCATRTHDFSRVNPSWVVSVTWGYRGNPSSEGI